MDRLTDRELERTRDAFVALIRNPNDQRVAWTKVEVLKALEELKELRAGKPLLTEAESELLDQVREEIRANPYVLGGEERSTQTIQALANLRADVAHFREQRDRLQTLYTDATTRLAEEQRECAIWQARAQAAEAKIRTFVGSLNALRGL